MTPELWLAAFAAVNALDAALTLWALKLGGSEGNPLIRALMRRTSPAVALLAVKGAYLVAVGAMLPLVIGAMPWLTGAFALVAAWNLVQVARLRKT